MAIIRWSGPFRDLAHLQDRINRVLVDPYGRPGTREAGDDGLMTDGAWVPSVDIYKNGDHEVVLKAELPDMTREDIEITVDKGTLTIKGEKKFSGDVQEEQFHRIERRNGTFSRAFSLPQTVDASKAGAEYRNGVLTVRLPVREEAKPRQIKVEVAA